MLQNKTSIGHKLAVLEGKNESLSLQIIYNETNVRARRLPGGFLKINGTEIIKLILRSVTFCVL